MSFFKTSLILPFAVSLGLAQHYLPLQGEIVHDIQTPVDHLVVTLRDVPRHVEVARSIVSSMGGFQFTNVPEGDYEVEIADQNGNAISKDYVSLHGQTAGSLRLTLPEDKRQRPVSGVVSAAELYEPLPKAVKELRKAEALNRKGDRNGSIARLKRAIEIDPRFAAAYHNLGARYSDAGQMEQAREEFRKAVALDPSLARAFENLAVVSLRLKDLAGGEQAARSALALEPKSAKAQYLLGLSMAWQNKYSPETVADLRAASAEYPNAHALLAHIMAVQGRQDDARKEMQEFRQAKAQGLLPLAPN